jgi:hypothetical protein
MICRLLLDATFDVIDSRKSRREREGNVLKSSKGEATNQQEPENAGTPHAPQEGLVVNVHGDVTLSERLKRKHYRGGSHKLASEAVSHDDVDRRSGRQTWEEMVFDHENDRYQKTVTVKETGEVIVRKDERLSEHQGYGAARNLT